MKSFLLLIGGPILLWAVLLGPGWMLQGDQVFSQSLTALGLCLLPALASLAWITAAPKTPEMQLTAILGGSAVRLALTLGGGFALNWLFPEMFPITFFIWVSIFYLVALILEILLALRVNPTAG